MGSVEQRVGDLIELHLGISDRALLDSNFSELGVNSMDAVNFLKVINEEFDVTITSDVASGFSSLRDLINHLSG
ncbi:MAG: acyl carrier protein [Acidiferrobacterales bacterium]|nr:acyl carrier protein [Acidiferrobacterales bacterium]